MAAEVTAQILCGLHDSLMVLAPRGFHHVELTTVRHGEQLRVSSLETKGQGAKEPKPKPALHIDPKAEALRLSEGLTELSHLLAEEGRHWHGGRAQVDRSDTHADWRLLDEAGAIAWFHRLEHEQLSQLIYTDALFDVLSGTEPSFETLQQNLERTLGAVNHADWHEGNGRLTVHRPGQSPLEVPATCLGTYEPASFTFTWHHEHPDVRRIAAADARADGLSAFWRPKLLCDEGFAWSLAGSLAVSLGARGLFQVPQREAVLFLAIR